MKAEITDITLPVYNGMWRYRDEWKNVISTVCSTTNNDQSTVYNFNLHSHTGTYIETSQHKLNNNILLSSFDLTSFYGECLVVVVSANEREVTRDDFLSEVKEIDYKQYKKLIIATGWGKMHKEECYLKSAPFFQPELTQLLIDLNLELLGVDTPIIENQSDPYMPVVKLFNSNPNLLLLAPLLIDLNSIKTGKYALSCFPAFPAEVSGCLCRAILTSNTNDR